MIHRIVGVTALLEQPAAPNGLIGFVMVNRSPIQMRQPHASRCGDYQKNEGNAFNFAPPPRPFSKEKGYGLRFRRLDLDFDAVIHLASRAAAAAEADVTALDPVRAE